MHLEVWISVVSAAVTVVVAGVAGWQVREARRQAKAAEDQVREARRSAAAAEDQVEIMHRQHEADQAEREERDTERRKREMEQASLITIEVDHSDYINPYDYEYAMARVVIISKGVQVLRLRVKSIGNAGQVRFGRDVGGCEGEPLYSPPQVLSPHEAPHYVPFEYLDTTGRPINVDKNIFDATSPIKKWIDVDDVTITFTDLSGVRWERTGNRQPLRGVG